MLEIKDFSCGYGNKEIVKDISLDLEPGDRLAIIGPNGSGKTTFLRGLAGILPSSGTATYEGKDWKTLKPIDKSKEMAFFTQMNTVNFSYTVWETVMMGRYPYINDRLFSKPGPEDKKIVEEQLKKFGLWEERDRPITELSGGQLQRVLLARTFTQDPKIVLLDEPANHLDLKFQIELVENLKNWTQDSDRAAVGVFHDLDLALSFANKILLMDNGRAVYLGDPENLDIEALNRIYGFDVPEYLYSAHSKWKDYLKNENLPQS